METLLHSNKAKGLISLIIGLAYLFNYIDLNNEIELLLCLFLFVSSMASVALARYFLILDEKKENIELDIKKSIKEITRESIKDIRRLIKEDEKRIKHLIVKKANKINYSNDALVLSKINSNKYEVLVKNKLYHVYYIYDHDQQEVIFIKVGELEAHDHYYK